MNEKCDEAEEQVEIIAGTKQERVSELVYSRSAGLN